MIPDETAKELLQMLPLIKWMIGLVCTLIVGGIGIAIKLWRVVDQLHKREQRAHETEVNALKARIEGLEKSHLNPEVHAAHMFTGRTYTTPHTM